MESNGNDDQFQSALNYLLARSLNHFNSKMVKMKISLYSVVNWGGGGN